MSKKYSTQVNTEAVKVIQAAYRGHRVRKVVVPRLRARLGAMHYIAITLGSIFRAK